MNSEKLILLDETINETERIYLTNWLGKIIDRGDLVEEQTDEELKVMTDLYYRFLMLKPEEGVQ